MTLNRRLGILAVLFSLFAAPAIAQAQDVAGSGDHPLVGRYEGSKITFYQTKAYEELRLPDRQMPRGAQNEVASWSRDMSGILTSIRYEGPGDRSGLEIMRNYERALTNAGFEIVFFCRGDGECTEGGGIPTFWDNGRGGTGLPTTWDTTIYLLAERNDAAGHVQVGMLTVEVRARGETPLTAHTAVTIVESEPMQTDRITFVEASAIEEAFARDGRIAVYGITFDFDSADLRAESKPQIDELGQLLVDNPNLNVVIVGHTDSMGSFEYNLSLSQRRAQAVVDALASGYSISATRMTPAGAGMVSPVATNRTEDGRAQNRRVEIVELFSGN
ncbi:OmpA family protein [Pelagibacterium limicola]|uniref:OmpA family protein n=1 Tax=Pelagibacterium limicola TaxID=2791022 RepID=UPI0018AFC80F|nr:OmpA family protein [Pelagibacterium limicola]